jgi:hypothetical protein
MNPMQCWECGAGVDLGEAWCTGCGKPLDGEPMMFDAEDEPGTLLGRVVVGVVIALLMAAMYCA